MVWKDAALLQAAMALARASGNHPEMYRLQGLSHRRRQKLTAPARRVRKHRNRRRNALAKRSRRTNMRANRGLRRAA